MNRAELIDEIATRLDGTKKDAEKALDAVVDVIQRGINEGDKVRVKGLGVFESVEKAARQVRNPATGDIIEKAAGRVPRFRPSSDFKEIVEGIRDLPARLPGVGSGVKDKDEPAPKAPAKTTPAKTTATKAAPAKKAPAKTTATKAAPAKTTPAKTTATKAAPAKKAPAKKAPAKKAPAKKAPAKTTATKAAPAKKAPAKKAPAKKAPATKAPATKAPATTSEPAAPTTPESGSSS